MALNRGFDTYKQESQEYIAGIDSAHGRIKILFDTFIQNLDNQIEKHPKTDFLSLGKCLNVLTILSDSLNTSEGGELAENLLELYDYSRRTLREYLETKELKKLEEVYSIVTKLSEGWDGIDESKK